MSAEDPGARQWSAGPAVRATVAADQGPQSGELDLPSSLLSRNPAAAFVVLALMAALIATIACAFFLLCQDLVQPAPSSSEFGGTTTSVPSTFR